MKYQSTNKCVSLWLLYIYHSERYNTTETNSYTSRKPRSFLSCIRLRNTFGRIRRRLLKMRCKFFLWPLKSSRTGRVRRSEATLRSKLAPVLTAWGWILSYPWCHFLYVRRRCFEKLFDEPRIVISPVNCYCLPWSTLDAELYLSLIKLATWEKLEIFIQHVFMEQLPDMPWHLQSICNRRLTCYVKICMKWKLLHWAC